ncbi:MAG TPA: hypothetical protein VN822_10785 [Candidatus Acidoferrales bacterium]|nr:hypothetical protein [Candidatus Acidoferrales bacterium]
MIANLTGRIVAHRAASAIVVALLAGCLCPAHAQTSSKKRVEAFAKLPDWSGIWELDAFVGQSDGQQFSAEGQRKLKAYAEAGRPSFTPEYQAKYEQIKKSVEAAVAADPAHPPVTHQPLCQAPPFPATSSPGMFEWLVAPEETTFISTVGAVRHIYTDGRSHPPKDELWPTLMGDSIGRWEGGTLVVDTVATKQRLYMGELSGFFVPMSDQLHFVERIRMVNHNQMQIDTTTEDPVALTKPIHVTITYARVTDFNRMIEETDCEQNERDPVVNGRFTTVTH